MELTELDFSLGPVQLKSPFPFDLSAVLSSNQPHISRAEMESSGKASLDLEKQIVTPQGLQIKTTAQGEAIPGKQAEFSLSAQLDVDSLTLNTMNLNNVSVQVTARDGILRIDPLTAELYQGSITNTIRVDVRSETPKVQTRNNLNAIVIESLLDDLLDRKLLSGSGGIEANLDFQGLTSKEILRSLSGNLSLLFEKGAIRGVNIPALIRSTSALLKGEQAVQPEDQSTDFSSFTASADIQQGLIRRSTLELLSPLFTIKGQGQVDLLKKSLDYDLLVNIPETISKKYSELDKLKEKLQGSPQSGQTGEQSLEPKKLLKGLFD